MTPEKRLAVLHEILTDPANQVEQTADYHYIYRFDLGTMHRIADALGLPRTEPVLTSYRPEELGRLFRD
jgi:hypothetical protein